MNAIYRRLRILIAFLILSGVVLPVEGNSLVTGTTEVVSVASDGRQGDCFSQYPSISSDGRYVAFESCSSNLVEDDTNSEYDVFLHDRLTGETIIVSVASDGAHGNGWSGYPSISSDGRHVVFLSSSDNLVDGDTNGILDVFVHNQDTGETVRVSVASDGTEANYASYYPAISADGRYIAYTSDSSNLVEGDTNDTGDIFVHDLMDGETSRVSVASDGTQGNENSSGDSVSANGRYIAFSSAASNLVDDDTNSEPDIFVHDRWSEETTRVSVSSDGDQVNDDTGGPSISADGRIVAFESIASTLVEGDTNGVNDVFVHDRQTGETRRVSVVSDGTQGNNASWFTTISGDGRYVAIESAASNLVDGDTNNDVDIFVHDRQTGETTRVSVASDGTQGNNDSFYPSISGDGRFVTFFSEASNLFRWDSNYTSDVFVHDREGVWIEPLLVWLPMAVK